MVSAVTVSDFYGRKSTKDDRRSVTGQEADWRADCEREGLTPGRVFVDPDKSASRYARKPRPDYLALIEHIHAGGCELLSLWESSRGSRNPVEWFTLIDLCRERGVLIRVVTHGRTYDVRVRRDWRTLADDGVDSADESEKISERVTRGKRLGAAAGRPTGKLAYGFRRVYDDRGRFVEQVEHPTQGPVVREIVEGIAARISLGAIAEALNGRGVPTPRGRTWTAAHVHAIAKRPSYAGLRVHQGQVVGEGKWAPIVDPATWRKAKQIMSEPGRRHNNDSRLAHWLVGVVLCGACRASNLTTGTSNGYRSYTCRSCVGTSVAAARLESFLEPLIVGRLALPDAGRVFVPPRQDDAIAAAQEELAALEARLAEFRAEGAKPNGLSAAAVAEAERGLTPMIKALKARIDNMNAPPMLAGLEGTDVAARWYSFGPHIRREIVRRLADLVLAPGGRTGRRGFDHQRLADSRWVGDPRTWGEIWAAS